MNIVARNRSVFKAFVFCIENVIFGRNGRAVAKIFDLLAFIKIRIPRIFAPHRNRACLLLVSRVFETVAFQNRPHIFFPEPRAVKKNPVCFVLFVSKTDFLVAQNGKTELLQRLVSGEIRVSYGL